MFQIYLNFTAYNLAKPNECEENYIQIFGRELEEEKRLVFFPNKTWLASTKENKDHVLLECAGRFSVLHLFLSRSSNVSIARDP